MSGGAPLEEVDGYSVTISDHDNIMTLQLTSGVRGMHVLENTQADRDSGIVGQDTENSVTGQSPLTQWDILGHPTGILALAVCGLHWQVWSMPTCLRLWSVVCV